MAQHKKIVLLAPTSAAIGSDPFDTDSNVVTITVFDLQNTETATVQILDPITNTYKDYLPSPGGTLVKFTATLNTNTLYLDAGRYILNKTVTAVPVGVGLQFFL